MTRKEYIIIIIVLVVFLLAGYLYMRNGSPMLTNESGTPLTQEEANQGEVTMVPITDNTKYAKASGFYPQFSNADQAFNQKIKDFIDKGVTEHAKLSEENWKARYETAPKSEKISQFPSDDEKFEYIASTTVIRNDDQIVSAVIYIYEYTGGAHGGEAIATFNYDVKNKKEIMIDTYLESDPSFLAKLSTLSRSKLRTLLATRAQVKEDDIDTEMLNDGTTPTKSNFSLFTIPKDNMLTFYFTQYQVAAYVFGSSEITVELPVK